MRGEQRGKIPKTALRSFRASLKRARQGCPGVQGCLHQQLLMVTFQPFLECVLALPEASAQSSMAMSIPKSKESCWCGSHEHSTLLALLGMQGTRKVQWFLAKNFVKQSSSSTWKDTESYPLKYHWSLVKPNSLRKVWGLVLFFL